MDKIPKRKMKEIEPRLKFKNWFKGLKDFIETEERATILTDTELFTIVNYKLKPKYRVSLGTFERWKAPNTESNVETLGARFVMERKFKDMREPPKVQIPSSPTIYIQTANKEQQRIIDGLVNSPTINLEQGDNE